MTLDDFAAEIHAKLCAECSHTQPDAREILRQAFESMSTDVLKALCEEIDKRHAERQAGNASASQE